MFSLSNISKSYKTGDSVNKVLEGINISFPDTGLISILGKSGSGKSTLLNIIGLLEKPDSGELTLDGRKLTSLKRNEIDDYRNMEVSFVYQHFNLLEDRSTLENIIIPMMLGGEKEGDAEKKAKQKLKEFGIEGLASKKVSLLSGGEKQRISLIRATSNEPRIILADEPTGALDKRNGEFVMQVLKKESRTKLVILVSHNEELVRRYSDRIITLKEGKINNDEVIASIDSSKSEPKKQRRKKIDSKWSIKSFTYNLKKNSFKNAVMLLSGIIGYAFLLCSLGFYNGSLEASSKQRSNYLDYTVARVSKQTKITIEGSPMSLLKTSRPSKEEVGEKIVSEVPDIKVKNDYGYFLPGSLSCKVNGFPYSGISFSPIMDMSLRDRSKNFIIEGECPNGDSLEYCLVNEAFSKEVGGEAIGKRIDVFEEMSVEYGGVSDEISLSLSFLVVGIVDEFSFLSTPKVFYSYKAFEARMERSKLENISLAGEEINVASLVSSASEESPYAASSYLLFGSESSMEKLKNISKTLSNEGLTISSAPFEIMDSFTQLANAFSSSLLPFAIMEVVGIVFVLSILAYASFVERKKDIAIIMALGARRRYLFEMYASEPLFVGLLSSIFALLVSYPLSRFLSSLIERKFGIVGLLQIPYASLFGIPGLLILLSVLLGGIIIPLIGGGLPLSKALNEGVLEVLRDE